MSETEYYKAIVQLVTWKADGMDVDWSYPSGSIGDHLVVLFEAKNITDLMHNNKEIDARLKKLRGENGYFIYKTLVAQRIPQHD